jgi:hypothetical protein
MKTTNNFFSVVLVLLLVAFACFHSKSLEAQENSNQNTNGISFGTYQYWVPGASAAIPDYTNHQLVITTSAGTGVLPGGIQISSDKTYIWNSSWDKKVIKGTWKATGDPGYPIVLIKAQEGKNWKIGKSKNKNAEITIWDGFTWYNGKKVK